MYEFLEKIHSNNGIEAYFVKNSKANNFTINLFIIDTIEDKFIMNVLTAMLLMKKYQKYNASINNTNENLLNNISYSNVAITRKGEYQILEFFIEGPQENRESCLKTMEQVIEGPLRKPSDIFNDQSIKEEVDKLRYFVDSRKNNLSHYAISRLYEEMFKDENFSIGEYTDISILENISNNSLFSFYKNYFLSLPIKIIITGNIDEGVKKNIIEKIQIYDRSNLKELRERQYELEFKPKTIIECIDNNYNEKIVLGYRTDIKVNSDKYYAMLILNSLLGGGTYSKLFKKLRDEQSLTYEAFSLYEEFKGFLMIFSSCILGNSDLIIKSVESEIRDICMDNFTDEEFTIARNNLIEYFLGCRDSQCNIIDLYLKQIISKKYISIDSLIKKLENVTREDIKEVSNSLKLDTIYILKNK